MNPSAPVTCLAFISVWSIGSALLQHATLHGIILLAHAPALPTRHSNVVSPHGWDRPHGSMLDHLDRPPRRGVTTRSRVMTFSDLPPPPHPYPFSLQRNAALFCVKTNGCTHVTAKSDTHFVIFSEFHHTPAAGDILSTRCTRDRPIASAACVCFRRRRYPIITAVPFTPAVPLHFCSTFSLSGVLHVCYSCGSFHS